MALKKVVLRQKLRRLQNHSGNLPFRPKLNSGLIKLLNYESIVIV